MRCESRVPRAGTAAFGRTMGDYLLAAVSNRSKHWLFCVISLADTSLDAIFTSGVATAGVEQLRSAAKP